MFSIETKNYFVIKIIPNLVDEIKKDLEKNHQLFQALYEILVSLPKELQSEYYRNLVKQSKKSKVADCLLLFFVDYVISSNFKNKLTNFSSIYKCDMSESSRLINIPLAYLKINKLPIYPEEYFRAFDSCFLRKGLLPNEVKNDNIYLIVRSFSVGIHSGAHFSLFIAIIESLIKVWASENIQIKIVGQYDVPSSKKNRSHLVFRNLIKLGLIPASNIQYISLDDYLKLSSIEKWMKNINSPILVMGGRVVEDNLIHPILYCESKPIIYIKVNAKNNVKRVWADLVISPTRITKPKVKVPEFQITYPVSKKMKNYVFENRNLNRLDDKTVINKKIKLISVLSLGRLEQALKKLSDNEVKKIQNYLSEGKVTWVFVGVEDSSIINQILGYESIDCYEFVDDLVDLYNKMDLFVHFPGAPGGGTGMFMAAYSSLPVIALKDTDAAGYLDDRLLPSSNDELFNMLDKFIKSSDERIKYAKKQLAFIEKTQEEGHFANALKDIIATTWSS